MVLIWVVTTGALARKCVTPPGPKTMRYMRGKVRAIVGRWETLGKTRTVGRNRGTRRIELSVPLLAEFPPWWSGPPRPDRLAELN